MTSCTSVLESAADSQTGRGFFFFKAGCEREITWRLSGAPRHKHLYNLDVTGYVMPPHPTPPALTHTAAAADGLGMFEG